MLGLSLMDGNIPVIFVNTMGSHEYSGEVVEFAENKHVTTPFTREIGVCDSPTMSIAL